MFWLSEEMIGGTTAGEDGKRARAGEAKIAMRFFEYEEAISLTVGDGEGESDGLVLSR